MFQPPSPPLDNDNVIGSKQCLCLPKAELKTKNSTKPQLCCRSVEFLVFNSIYLKISVPSNGRNRVPQVRFSFKKCIKWFLEGDLLQISSTRLEIMKILSWLGIWVKALLPKPELCIGFFIK